MEQQTIIIGFTGHKDIRNEDVPIVKERIKDKIQELLKLHLGKQLDFISGNADGADTLFGEVLQELKALKLSHKIIFQDHKNGEKDEDYYERLAKEILQKSEIVIAVWNGVFNYKPNGTSDIVNKALENKLTIYHLVTPRQSNHFPLNSLAKPAIDYNAKQFTRIPFTVNFSWHIESPSAKEEMPKQYVYDEYTRPLIFNYFIPIGLALLTLFTGWFGFNNYEECSQEKDFLNNLFNAVNLITLNSSALERPSNTILNVARLSGLIALIYTFGYALFLAFGRHRQSFIRRFWKGFLWSSSLRKYSCIPSIRTRSRKGFVLVLGLNEKSMNLIRSLNQKGERIVLLTENETSVYDIELKKLKKQITVRGSLSSGTMLEYVYAAYAKEIYIMSDNDSKNVRATQELDILLQERQSSTQKIFVHLLDEEHSKFLRDSLHHISNDTTIFSIYENITRRLLLHFPPDRFYQCPQSNVLHAIIIGFDEMGKELMQNLLKQAHYQKDKKVSITVYCSNAKHCKDKFQKQNPLVFNNESDFDALKEIKNEIWHNISISFVELPLSDADWLNDELVVYKGLDEKHILTIYTGLDNGIYSASYLKGILPKLNYLKKKTGCDIQVFCYYNFPDKKEEAHIEAYLNKLAPELFVKCFGNFVDECGVDAVKSMALDAMAKLINAFYAKKQHEQDKIFEISVEKWEGFTEDETNKPWSVLSTRYKMSSQQAGDHLWAKLRILHVMKDWDFDSLYYRLNAVELSVLAEIEHRRWSAELLLQGFVPFDEMPGSDRYKEIAEKWNDQKVGISEKEAAERTAFKKERQLMKCHIDLVQFDKLYGDEVSKDNNQIKTIPYFLKQMLPIGIKQKTMNSQGIVQINTPHLVYLLLYAAHIDNNISPEEKGLIVKHLTDANQWQYLVGQFDKMNEKEKAEQVLDIINQASKDEKQLWLQAIKELMNADGNFSSTEQYILGLLKK